MKAYCIAILLLIVSRTAFAQADTTSGWKIVFSNPKYSIGGLQFFPPSTVYATAYNGSILLLMRSFDQGVTWDTLSTPIPIGYVTFTSPSVGFSADDPTSKHVWKTIDGGQTWQSYPRNSVSYGPIVFANQDTGIVLSASTIARTTDGGQSWEEVYPSIANCDKGGCFGSSTVGYSVGLVVPYVPNLNLPSAGGCQKTTDAGKTWTQVYTGIPHQLSTCYSTAPNVVFVAGAGGILGRSLDGGNSWDTTVVGVNSSDFSAFSFADSLHGMLVGALSTLRGLAASTTDGGTSWQKQVLPSGNVWLTGVAMLNDSIAIICGSGYIYRTTTGGAFSSVPQQQNPSFQVQVFPNPTSGLVTIQYTLPSSSEVSFRFYDANGATLKQINAVMQSTGIHETTFDASSLASGVYYFTMTTGQGEYHGKIEVAK